ncbi:hypothetical protein E4U23_005098, partial [Claviceps purpurea]
HYGDTEFTKLVLEILKATHLKTMYTDNLKYQELLRLKEVVRSKGTKLIQEREPYLRPIPLDR